MHLQHENPYYYKLFGIKITNRQSIIVSTVGYIMALVAPFTAMQHAYKSVVVRKGAICSTAFNAQGTDGQAQFPHKEKESWDAAGTAIRPGVELWERKCRGLSR